jgi:hypothetical protein
LEDVILRHKSQLEKEKEAFAAKKVARGVSADRPVPGYMKATAAYKVSCDLMLLGISSALENRRVSGLTSSL